MGEVIRNCFPPFKRTDADDKPRAAHEGQTLGDVIQKTIRTSLAICVKYYGPKWTAAFLEQEIETLRKVRRLPS